MLRVGAGLAIAGLRHRGPAGLGGARHAERGCHGGQPTDASVATRLLVLHRWQGRRFSGIAGLQTAPRTPRSPSLASRRRWSPWHGP